MAKLPQNQTELIWKKMLEAEVRSLYFGDLAASYTKRKQVITGASFFLSSGAAATLAAQMPHWIPLFFTAVTAILASYAMAVGLDKKALAMSRLHSDWNHLSADYRRLWYHWFEDDAEEVLEKLLMRARQASEMATLEAPYCKERLDKWADHVYAQYITDKAAA